MEDQRQAVSTQIKMYHALKLHLGKKQGNKIQSYLSKCL